MQQFPWADIGSLRAKMRIEDAEETLGVVDGHMLANCKAQQLVVDHFQVYGLHEKIFDEEVLEVFVMTIDRDFALYPCSTRPQTFGGFVPTRLAALLHVYE